MHYGEEEKGLEGLGEARRSVHSRCISMCPIVSVNRYEAVSLEEEFFRGRDRSAVASRSSRRTQTAKRSSPESSCENEARRETGSGERKCRKDGGVEGRKGWTTGDRCRIICPS